MQRALLLEPFTNNIGQSINVGDDVIFMATCRKTTYMKTGKFGGILMAKVGKIRTDDEGKHVIENGRYVKDYIDDVVSVRVDSVSSKKFVYDYKTAKGKYIDVIRSVVLPLKRVYKTDTSLNEIINMRF